MHLMVYDWLYKYASGTQNIIEDQNLGEFCAGLRLLIRSVILRAKTVVSTFPQKFLNIDGGAHGSIGFQEGTYSTRFISSMNST